MWFSCKVGVSEKNEGRRTTDRPRFRGKDLGAKPKTSLGRKTPAALSLLQNPAQKILTQIIFFHMDRLLVCIAIFAPAKQGIHRVESGPLQMRDK